MTILIVALALTTVLAIGVGLMLYQDHREQKRIVQNGGRRF